MIVGGDNGLHALGETFKAEDFGLIGELTKN
jgi:hypothetical protein